MKGSKIEFRLRACVGKPRPRGDRDYPGKSGTTSHVGSYRPVTSLLLFLLIAACQTGLGDKQVDVKPLDLSVPAEYVELLGPVAAWQLANLQRAIDVAVENEVANCMAAVGFRYHPRTYAQLAARDAATENAVMLQFAEQAIDSLSPPDPVPPSPNKIEYGKLPVAEQAQWDREENRCFVEHSTEHQNPLAEGGTWLDLAMSEASQLTTTDPRIVAAQRGMEICFGVGGFGSPESAMADLQNAARSIVESVQRGTVATEVALTNLRLLATTEATASELLHACQSVFLRIERKVFVGYLSSIAAGDSDGATRWASSIKAAMEPYLEMLPSQTSP